MNVNLVGQRLAGRYTLSALLGHGGMGAVYEAFDDAGERVAIKILEASAGRERFAREARILTGLRSPHVVAARETGTDAGRPYLVMELLRGHDLGERLRRERRLSLDDTLGIGGEILEGLAAAHEAGVVHRDLKPDNVFLAEQPDGPPRATLIDFGMSKQDRPASQTAALALTTKGTVLGTPLYLSPEQARAGDVDARADLYGVGAILFECLTGRPPHVGETHEQVLLAICTRDVPDPRAIDPRIPRDVAKLLLRALARERDARFPTARAMAAALAAVRAAPVASPALEAPSSSRAPKDLAVAGRPGAPAPSAEGTPASAPHRPRRLAIGLLAAACGGVFSALVVLGTGSDRPRTSAPNASSTTTPDPDAAAPASASASAGP